MGQILPEAESIKSLNKAGAVIAFVFGVIYILYFIEKIVLFIEKIVLGNVKRFDILDTLPFIRSTVNFVIAIGLIRINKTIDRWEFREVKKKQFVWTLIAFILGIITINMGAIVVGIIAVMAYKKYGDLPAFE